MVNEAVRYCSQCGQPISAGGVFCSQCGARMPEAGLPIAQTAFPAFTPIAPSVATQPSYSVPGPSTPGYAGLWRRTFALLFDAILLLVLIVPIRLLLNWACDEALSRTVLDPAGLGYDRLRIEFELLKGALTLGIAFGYGTLLEWSVVQGTIGKRLMGCRVTDRAGSRVGFFRAVWRNLCKPLSALPCLLGLLMTAVMPRKQALHDLLSGCVVMKR